MALGDILVEVQGVAKHFGEGETRVDALRSVDLTVRAGEVIALLECVAEHAEAKERTARIESQQRLADMQELAAKSGLAHRKAVQEAVREALHEAKKACENLPAPEACSGVERSLWDVATMACAEAVGNVGTP